MPGRIARPVREPVKRALSIAVQYSRLREFGMDLPGTHKDPIILSNLLIEIFNYREEDIMILMDDDDGEYRSPTRENIMKAMYDLVADAQPGDHFVLHFSGHGGQIPNLDGTEEDGLDEVIFPVDIDYRGPDDISNYIMDDEFHDLIDNIPVGAHFMMVFDCCHSGTMADLPFSSETLPGHSSVIPVDLESALSSPIDSPKSGLQPRSVRMRGTQAVRSHQGEIKQKDIKHKVVAHHPTDVESWSACEDSKLALGDEDGGLFMRAFAKALRGNPRATHEELLSRVIREMSKLAAAAILKKRGVLPKRTLTLPTPEFGCERPMDEVLYNPIDL